VHVTLPREKEVIMTGARNYFGMVEIVAFLIPET
jgi:hypothetical protein